MRECAGRHTVQEVLDVVGLQRAAGKGDSEVIRATCAEDSLYLRSGLPAASSRRAAARCRDRASYTALRRFWPVAVGRR